MKKSTAIAVCLLGAAGLFWFAQAGDLEPPGPPAPTMKTLDEVEPRIPIRASDLPLTISQPGSYLLAESISTTGDGITIDADNVTLDLMGHALLGGTGSGITTEFGRKSIEIKNGTVAGWPSTGVHVRSANTKVTSIRVEGNGNGIIWAGLAYPDFGSIIEGCIAHGNSGVGISCGNGGLIRGCNATSNGGDGIVGYPESTIVDCSARYNTGNGIVAYVATVKNCHVGESGGHGIFAGERSHIIDNTVDRNDGDGIYVEYSSTVSGNLCVWNDHNDVGAGIRVVGYWNRIDGNHANSNAYGIKIEHNANFVIRNTSHGNTQADYDLTGTSNGYGPIEAASSSTSPWANLYM